MEDSSDDLHDEPFATGWQRLCNNAMRGSTDSVVACDGSGEALELCGMMTSVSQMVRRENKGEFAKARENEYERISQCNVIVNGVISKK